MSLLTPAEGEALLLSLRIAAVAVAASLPFAFATALLLARRDFPGKLLLDGLVHLPLVLPPVATGFLLLLLLGTRTGLGAFLLDHFGIRFVFSWTGAALASAILTFPFQVRAIRLVLEAQDRGLDEAARTLGAGSWLTFRRVILPTLWPAIWSGSGQAFSRALGEFGSVLMVSGNRPMETTTAATYVYSEIEGGRQASAVAVSLALLACSLGLLLLVNALQRRGESANAA